MTSDQIVTLSASAVALLAVLFSFWASNKQVKASGLLAAKQLEATAAETARRLRAEFLIKEKQAWLREFREVIHEVLYLADPDLDDDTEHPLKHRIRALARSAIKVELLLPKGEQQAKISGAMINLSIALRETYGEDTTLRRLDLSAKLIEGARATIQTALKDIESAL